MAEPILAILFDMNGTLRTCQSDPHTQAAARAHILELLGKEAAQADYWEVLEQRYRAYSVWAAQTLIQAPEMEVWTRWMLPEEPEERVAACADELMLAWIGRNGSMLPDPETGPLLQELKRRGYRLGVVSNSISTLDIPRFIRAWGWNEYLDAVVLSWHLNSRKPAPELFHRAAALLQVAPRQCAYVGNRAAKDIAGCQQAGFGMGVMLKAGKEELGDKEVQPDASIRRLTDLLAFFPAIQNSQFERVLDKSHLQNEEN